MKRSANKRENRENYFLSSHETTQNCLLRYTCITQQDFFVLFDQEKISNSAKQLPVQVAKQI
jgi:hypothetical protein